MHTMEFQAVILAGGKGSRMTDLTASTPKALLPIANRPMIWYPVKMLENAGFDDVIIVVNKAHQSDIQKALVDICGVKIKLDFVVMPPNDDWGTADSLRHIKDKINTDMLIVSCDLITDVALHRIADLHRTHNSSLTMLLAPLVEPTELSTPGGKSNRKIERDLVGMDDAENRVLFFSSEADFEETVSFRKSLFKSHPCMTVHTQLLDGHLYIMKKWVLDLLAQDTSVAAIKGELVPDLVRQQFSQKKKAETQDGVGTNYDKKPDLQSLAEPDSLMKMALEFSSFDLQSPAGSVPENIRCYGYIHKEGFCQRVNTIVTYCEANRQIPKQLSVFLGSETAPLIHESVVKQGKSQVGSDSMVGDGSSIGEKAAVKRSVIGRHCTIGDKVKITNSVIMDHVVIEEGSTLTGCIVCENTQLGQKCELKDCLLGSSQHINSLAKFTNEVLVDLNRMMEI